MPAIKANEYYAHLCSFQNSVKNSVSKKSTNSKDTYQAIWDQHCLEYGINTNLQAYGNDVPQLAVFVFAERYRSWKFLLRKNSFSTD